MNKKWDDYFLKICGAVSSNSKCMSRQIGAILVRDKSILATGYNGPPSGTPHCSERYEKDLNLSRAIRNIDTLGNLTNQCPRRVLSYESGEGLEWCIAAHAETNCIANAAKNGVSVDNTTMYMTCGIPCKNCLSLIINSGVKALVCTSLKTYDKTTEFILSNSELLIRTYLKEEE